MGDNVNRRQLQREAGQVAFRRPDLDIGTLGSVAFRDGNISAALSPEQRAQSAAFGQLAQSGGEGISQLTPGQTAFGRGAFDTANRELAGAASLDPLDQAETRFNRLQDILQRGRDRTRSSTEERLFRQGRLSSGIGAEQLGEVERGFAEADALTLDRLVQSAEGQRRGRLADALAAGGAGQDISTGFGNRLSAGVQGQGVLDNRLLQLLQASSALGAQDLAGQQARVSAIRGANESNAATNTGGGGLSGGILGAITGGLSGIPAGPVGVLGGAVLGGAQGSQRF